VSTPREIRLRALGRQIAAEQDAELAASEELATRAAMRAVVVHTTATSGAGRSAIRAGRGPRWTMFAIGAIAATACACALWLSTRALEVSIVGGASLPLQQTAGAHDTTVALRFSDRSEILLARDARMRLLALTRRGATLRLEAGSARVHVTAGRGGEWTLHAGRFAVHVTGTRFSLDYDPRAEELVVHMLEGSVLVTGCTLVSARALSAGESMRASCRAGTEITDSSAPAPRTAQAPSSARRGTDTSRASEGSARERPSPSSPALAKPDVDGVGPERRRARDQPSPSSAVAARREQTATVEPSWQQLARAGKFAAAYALGNEVPLETMRVSDVLLLGDAARLSGETTAALQIYERLRQLHPGTDAAAAAAFASGRLQFDRRSAFSDAARWFETYLRERDKGPLAREARGRMLEALQRSGQHAAAAQSATQYLKAYPTGPHAAFARGVLRAE
jgi:transmembrane sensor